MHGNAPFFLSFSLVGRAIRVITVDTLLPSRETHLDLAAVASPAPGYPARADLEEPCLGNRIDDSTAAHIEEVVLLAHFSFDRGVMLLSCWGFLVYVGRSS